MKRPAPNRRDFLKTTSVAGVAAATVPYFFSQSRSLADQTVPSGDPVSIGIIGAGGMAMGNIDTAKQWLRVVAIADVDSRRGGEFNEKLAGGKADVVEDYRSLLDRKDIDVIHIATPDHWHTKPLIEAMRAGKDVYCEKPLTLTIDEGKLIRRVQQETGRVVQVGTQQRSTFDLFVKAMAIVNEGRIGKLKRLHCAIGGAPDSPAIPATAAPQELNWDRWLGPAPAADYRTLTVDHGQGNRQTFNNNHYEFRWWYEYSGGKLTDWGAHHVDIANWALTLNGQTAGPESISGTATHPVEFQDGFAVQKDRYNTATKFNFTLSYPGGTEVLIMDTHPDFDNGVLIEGDAGRIFVNRGRLTGAAVDQLKDNPLPEDAISKVYQGMPMEGNERYAHWANFLYCHREGKQPISDVHSHMAGLNLCHLAGIAARLGRDLKWDAAAEQIVGDDQANGFLARPYREGYEIEG